MLGPMVSGVDQPRGAATVGQILDGGDHAVTG